MAPEPLDQQIDRLFAEHRDHLGRLTGEQLRAAARRFGADDRARSRFGTAKRLCLWSGRLVLCLLAAAVAMATLSNELVAGGYATQSTEWLAASDLAIQKLLRRVSHGLKLYDTELARSLGDCILTNPFHSEPPTCCGCGRLRIAQLSASQANLSSVARLLDSLYNRAVSPFLLAAPVQSSLVDFARLASFVSDNRLDFERGANVIRTLAAAAEAAPTVRRFADLFPPTTPPPVTESPPGQLILWSFSHLSAIRALRRLVPRPAYFGRRTERTLSTSLLLAGRDLPPGRLFPVGDFPGYRSLAFARSLSGRLTVRLAQKVACCGPDVGGVGGSAASELLVLEPGRALFFPTDCHELLVGRGPEDSGAASLVQFGFVYNGAHQGQRKSG